MDFLSKIGMVEWLGIIFIICTAYSFATIFKQSQQTYAVPFITTLGIFFTFLGVTLGLLGLDEKNITDSLPKLLEGLKVAFLPSAIAIFFALVFKGYFIWNKSKNKEDDVIDNDASISDMIRSLKSIESTLKKSLIGDGENSLATILTRSLSGDGENSLATILTKMRTENIDFAKDNLKKLDELKKAQEDALLKMSENSSKQLVEALEEVIKDFNNKISEQFGENFKQLNTAVGRLLEWQDKYKIYIETTEKTNSAISESMQIASTQYQTLVSEARVFTKISQDLSGLLNALAQQKNTLSSQLRALATLVLDASRGLPQIEENILSITNGLKNASLKNQEILEQSINEHTASIKKSIQVTSESLEKANSDLGISIKKNQSTLDSSLLENAQQIELQNRTSKEKLEEMLQATGTSLKAMTDNLSSDIDKNQTTVSKALESNASQMQQTLANTSKSLETMTGNLSSDINRMSNQLNQLNHEFNNQIKELSNKQFTALETELSAALTKSLNSLGSQLATLSDKFVSDYKPLTDKLQKIIEISKNNRF